ncbi:MAG: DUF3999 family protein [Winogradskyella sp.]|uniref:DUF3999 family protein n=1 Tax=Winogradskyella sp. TaxID=1883156 RepID=UPI00385DBCA1
MLKTKLLIAFFIGFTTFCVAQIDRYNYKRSLSNINEEWHQLTIPNAVFGKLNTDFSDIRIFGITPQKDTIQAPYFLNELLGKVVHKTIPFAIINKTKGADGYYFTFQLDANESINQINLNFSDQNFDWKVDLQGSQNQQEWFTILEEYRILSIKNELTNFKFTKLNFPETKYRFYRLLVKHDAQPELNTAQLSKHDFTEGNHQTHPIKTIKNVTDKKLKTTTLHLELEEPLPLSQLDIDVSNTFDYYRPLKIEYKSDSVQTEKGWKYRYKTITSGTLNSLEANRFKFTSTVAKHLKITIYNGDNQPLSVTDVAVKGYQFQLIGRFTEPANYMLVYGKTLDRIPNYDIVKFESKVPEQLKALQIGEEQVIIKSELKKAAPLFENSYWLWGIIGVVILLLGGFTLRMLRKS